MPYVPVPYSIPRQSQTDMLAGTQDLLKRMRRRRSCRQFSDQPVPRNLIGDVGGCRPHRAQWRQPSALAFVAVDDPELKREIRIAAEKEEHESYTHRMPATWLNALEPLGTDEHKPFLEIAPWLVIVFQRTWEYIDGQKQPNYYPMESVGLAAGMFLTACHLAGLATLTHTPSR
jgi:iodotyrosine deiodinase